MIGHIEHGSDFGGLFRYLLANYKGARIIGGNVAGETPSELTQEFNNCADLRRTTTKPVKHLIISFAPADGKINDTVKARIAQTAVRELGYKDNQYLVIDHNRNDPGHDWNHDHEHIHIAINMITLDGKRVDDWQDQRKFEAILRQLEPKFNLSPVSPSKQRKRKALSHGQTQRYKRELNDWQQGKRPNRPEIPLTIKLQAAIDAASFDRPTITEFIGRLQHLGIDVCATISDQGRKRISYLMPGNEPIRGSKLHQASFPQLLSHRGLDFELSRDRAAMSASQRGEQVVIDSSRVINWSDLDFHAYLPEHLSQSQTQPSKLEQDENYREETRLNEDKPLKSPPPKRKQIEMD
jgi:hypothetical protein